MNALGTLPADGMNGTERAYAWQLEARKRAGEVLWYRFEGVTLKLANDTRYTPDFLVMLADRTLECHEVKGQLREDAWIKLKFAAHEYPLVFRMYRKKRNVFTELLVEAA